MEETEVEKEIEGERKSNLDERWGERR